MIGMHRWMGWLVAVAVLACVLASCSRRSDGGRGGPAMSERQRDSTIAKSRLPGSGVVGRAMAASDSARAREARADSLAR